VLVIIDGQDGVGEDEMSSDLHEAVSLGWTSAEGNQSTANRAAQILAGHSFLAVINWLFDNPLYLYVIYRLGPLNGGVVMTTLSLVISLALLLTYERMRVDWLGVNVLESVKERGDRWISRLYESPLLLRSCKSALLSVLRAVSFIPSRLFLAVLWALKKGDGFAFFALSLYTDPFITTAFLRHGRFDGFRHRDWLLFAGSVVVGNGYWILRSVAIVELAKESWRLMYS
jgi:hypothetical protein